MEFYHFTNTNMTPKVKVNFLPSEKGPVIWQNFRIGQQCYYFCDGTIVICPANAPWLLNVNTDIIKTKSFIIFSSNFLVWNKKTYLTSWKQANSRVCSLKYRTTSLNHHHFVLFVTVHSGNSILISLKPAFIFFFFSFYLLILSQSFLHMDFYGCLTSHRLINSSWQSTF